MIAQPNGAMLGTWSRARPPAQDAAATDLIALFGTTAAVAQDAAATDLIANCAPSFGDAAPRRPDWKLIHTDVARFVRSLPVEPVSASFSVDFVAHKFVFAVTFDDAGWLQYQARRAEFPTEYATADGSAVQVRYSPCMPIDWW